MIKKLVLALVTLAKRLRPYFHAYTIFALKFEPRGAIKTQALADFLVEMMSAPKEDSWWTLHVDDSSNPKGGGIGIILEGPTCLTLENSLKFDFKASNNQAKYEALLAGLDLAREVGTQRKFEKCEVQHVPRNNNSRTDALAWLATTKTPPRHTVFHKNYLHIGTSLEDKSKAAKVHRMANRYIIEANHLYKRGFSTLLLKCMTKTQADCVLNEIHKGICGFHLGGRTMATRALRVSYY
ncbi:hypothetical protein CR513_31245, partial [Mucuna pruriens]